MSTLTTPVDSTQRTRSNAAVVSGLLLAAFTLSVLHTGYAWLRGLEDPDFTVTTPVAWAFYAVAFASAVLVRVDRRWVAWTVAAYLVVLLAISVFYYPTTFTVEKQSVFGWFENDVYVGLLVAALVLLVLRLRHVTLVTRR
jgi:hypothetical protein